MEPMPGRAICTTAETVPYVQSVVGSLCITSEVPSPSRANLTLGALSLAVSSSPIPNTDCFAGASSVSSLCGGSASALAAASPRCSSSKMKLSGILDGAGISFTIGKPGEGDSDENIIVRIEADAPTFRPGESVPANPVF